jgi:hypothetical protein
MREQHRGRERNSTRVSNVQRLCVDKKSKYYPFVQVHVPEADNQSNTAGPAADDWRPMREKLAGRQFI